MKAGVIGLGNIGGGVAQCLARAGQLAAVFDVRPEAVDTLPIDIANCRSPRELTLVSDVVLIAVFDAAQARAVLTGPDGVLAADRREVPIVLLSTVSLDQYSELQGIANASGCELIDCGVTGGSSAASGGLVCLVGADAALFDRVKPVLEAFAQGVYRLGEAGAGMAGKIARNVIIYGTWLVEYEAFKLAKAAGLDRRELIAAVIDSRRSVAQPCAWPSRDPEIAIEVVDDDRRRRSASVLQKDLGAALELAQSFGIALPAAELARANGAIITGLEQEAFAQQGAVDD